MLVAVLSYQIISIHKITLLPKISSRFSSNVLIPVFFTDDESGLMLKYQTDINIDDVASLQLEAQEFWPLFKLDVEGAGKNIGILQATGPKEQVFGPLITTARHYSFVWTRESTGEWHLYEGDSKEGDDGL